MTEEMDRLRRQLIRDGEISSLEAFLDGYAMGFSADAFEPNAMRRALAPTPRQQLERAWADVGAALRSVMSAT